MTILRQFTINTTIKGDAGLRDNATEKNRIPEFNLTGISIFYQF